MKYKLDNYFEFRNEKTIKDILLYMSLAFRPFFKLLFSFILTFVISFICIIVMLESQKDKIIFDIAFAIFTGVVASGLVSLVICMIDNFSFNYKRLLVLHEYFLAVADYKNYDSLLQECLKDMDCSGVTYLRDIYNIDLVINLGPTIESAYNGGREYMSLSELGYVKSQIDLYHSIAESHNYLDDIDASKQNDLRHKLESFDYNMVKLKEFIKFEPRYYTELISVNSRFEKYREQLYKQIDLADRRVISRLKKAVKSGRISADEYEEFLQIDDEASRENIYGYDAQLRRKRMMKALYILAKADGKGEEILLRIQNSITNED